MTAKVPSKVLSKVTSKLCRPPFVFGPHTPAAFTTPALCAAYNFPKFPVTLATPLTIGILELGGGYAPSDLTSSAARYAYPAPFAQGLPVGGGKNSPGGAADGEVALDMQVAAAAYSYCTGLAAKLVMAWCPNTGAAFAAGVKALVDAKVAVISISWGAPEDSWTASDIASMQAALQAARAAAVPVLVASGDSGSSDGESGNHVDFPASSPLVVGCGGTSLRAANPRSEVVWNAGGGAGGGGVSTRFALPTYQAGFLPSGLAGRGVPDLSGNADPATGYRIILNGAEQVIGGTSAVAPLVAGLLAAFRAGGADLANLPDRLYPVEPAFYDIVTGNNGAYSATKGYDLATGLGSLDGTALYAALKGGPPVTPPPVGAVTAQQAKDAAAHGLQAYAARPEYAGKRNEKYRALILGGIPWTDLYLDHLYQGVKP